MTVSRNLMECTEGMERRNNLDSEDVLSLLCKRQHVVKIKGHILMIL